MRKTLTLLLALAAFPAQAQDSATEADQDFLTEFLQDSLSDAGRVVIITGFEGALSTRATIDTLTIADDAGIWLTLTGLTLDWSRSSLLSGELVVAELSADTLDLTRWSATDGLPQAEAPGFSLPDLPVSIDIDKVAIDQITLDEAVLGQPVQGRLDAALQLADGAGQARLDLTRHGDGPTGQIALDAAFSNATRQLNLTLTAGESQGGLIVSALNIPGRPATDFRISGAGPISDFVAEVSLATDGQDRLAGTVRLNGDDAGGVGLQADLGGNLAPLFLPDYAEFLGTDLRLALNARRASSGAVTVERLSLQAQSLSVEGQVSLAADGVPSDLLLRGKLAAPDGDPLLLPLGGAPTRINSATFTLASGQADGSGWTLDANLAGLDQPNLTVADLSLTGSGQFERGSQGSSVNGTLQLAASGLSPRDPAVAKAIGAEVQATVILFQRRGEPFELRRIQLQGQDYAVEGRLAIDGLQTGFLTSGQVSVTASDLSRFDQLAGFPIAGRGRIEIEGAASPLSGFIDGTLALSANGLKVGIEQADRLLAGVSSAHLSLLRDETGTTVRALDIRASTLTASGAGKITSADSTFDGRLEITDLAVLDPTFAGSARLGVSVLGAVETGTRLTLSGTTQGLALGQPALDRVLGGDTSLDLALDVADRALTIASANLVSKVLEFSVTGGPEGGRQNLAVSGRLGDLGLLVPNLNGPLSVSGTILDDGSTYRVDLAGRGPGGVDGTITGSLTRNLSTADLSLSGTGQAALANLFISPRVLEGLTRFDLRLRGPLRLASLSGQVTLSNGRLSDPRSGLALQAIDATANLASGRANTLLTAGVSTGGTLRLNGPVALAPPFDANLSVALNRVRVLDRRVYETLVTGPLRITGPLAGGALISGALSLSESTVRVPESGIDAAGILADVTHRKEPAAVKATRARAGLLGNGGGRGTAAARAFRLDLSLSAPSRIFLRGRGIDAELGGQLRLRGTTAAVVPAGEFTLIRGRFDILGRRLVLDRADLQLQGSFVPYLDVSASTQAESVRAVVTIQGPATDPQVSFASTPELPQEEVLALLLFGRGLDSISPLQAAQLAQAVAQMAGRGGEGLIGNLRKSFGLDDLDVTTTDDGTAALKAGKYISENVYTEIEVDQAGTSRINLNLDLRPGVTVKGRVGADGDTGIGIFIERDY